ncbi:hypothetical protein BDZ88DRAFT_480165, partial [Geranomyces variabilis]
FYSLYKSFLLSYACRGLDSTTPSPRKQDKLNEKAGRDCKKKTKKIIMIWIPRALFRFLGPSRKSTGTTALTTTTTTTTPKAHKRFTTKPTSKQQSASRDPDVGGSQSQPPPPPNTAEFVRLRATFRLWILLFVVVMSACVVNVVALDVLWLKKTAGTAAANATAGNSTVAIGGTNGTNATTATTTPAAARPKFGGAIGG